jgi:hypothetical protein
MDLGAAGEWVFAVLPVYEENAQMAGDGWRCLRSVERGAGSGEG